MSKKDSNDSRSLLQEDEGGICAGDLFRIYKACVLQEREAAEWAELPPEQKIERLVISMIQEFGMYHEQLSVLSQAIKELKIRLSSYALSPRPRRTRSV
jgi:hypothetical protein